MKSIKLTEEHKEKLLEMCKVLFPKYTFIEWNLLGKKAWDAGYLKYYKDSDKYASFIHWFEFCSIHLCEKILKPNINKMEFFWETNFYATLSKEHKHPIDYLYEEFKKLKK